MGGTDNTTGMPGNGDVSQIQAFYANIESGSKLLATFQEAKSSSPANVRPSCNLGIRHQPAVDGAIIIIWMIGTGAAAWAAWISTDRERMFISARLQAAQSDQGHVVGMQPQQRTPLGEGSDEEVELTCWQVGGLLVIVCVFLLILYMLVRLHVPVVYAIIVLFCIAGVSAAMQFIFSPLLHRMASQLTETGVDIPWIGALTWNSILSCVLAIAFVGVWAGLRHASWAFVLQDILGIVIVATILYRLRLPSLKLGVIIGLAFLLYDVVMVFLSPYIFGTSVMVDVATSGGGGNLAGDVDSYCYCRLHPHDKRNCGPGESMPILIRIPHFYSLNEGASMLGLGDLVLPGLLVAFAARWDYVRYGSLFGGYYWIGSVIAYAFGLAFANLAV